MCWSVVNMAWCYYLFSPSTASQQKKIELYTVKWRLEYLQHLRNICLKSPQSCEWILWWLTHSEKQIKQTNKQTNKQTKESKW